jgi:hypothetical protein
VIWVAYVWIVVHGPEGHEINVNPKRITSMRGRAPGAKGNAMVHDKAHCVLNMDDGKFIAVLETCSAVRQSIKEIPE